MSDPTGCGGCGGGIIDGAIGLAKAGLQVLGVPIDQASRLVVTERRVKCRHCPNASRNPDPKYAVNNGLTSSATCELCGCLIVAKTMLASEACPMDPPKWGAI